jgi:hypothetical protein
MMTNNRYSAEDVRQGEATGRIRRVLVISVLLAAAALLIAGLQFGAF